MKDRRGNKKGKGPLGGEQQGLSVVGRRRVAVGGKGGPGTQRQRNTHSCRVSTPISLYCSSCFTWASSCFSLESCGHKAEHRVNMAQQWASLTTTHQNCLVMTVHIHQRSAMFIERYTHTQNNVWLFSILCRCISTLKGHINVLNVSYSVHSSEWVSLSPWKKVLMCSVAGKENSEFWKK